MSHDDVLLLVSAINGLGWMICGGFIGLCIAIVLSK